MIKRILILVFLLSLITFSGIYSVKSLFSPASESKEVISVLIPKGSSVTQIGKILEEKKVIKSGLMFKFYVQLTNSQSKIQAGEFEISPNLDLVQVVSRLKKGPSEIWVTIPEGLRREEVALRFKESLNKDDLFVDQFLDLTKEKEGYLYPDTYLFAKTVTAKQIVDRMEAVFKSKIGNVEYDVLILASLLERETITDQEKNIVAGILYKRLNSGWPLQIDATLQYAKANANCLDIEKCNFWQIPLAVDKEIDSPYNTYKNTGLPPAPISSPGVTSIDAAKSPEDSDYWYYIHDKDGKIRYARTLDEHNNNVAKYLR